MQFNMTFPYTVLPNQSTGASRVMFGVVGLMFKGFLKRHTSSQPVRSVKYTSLTVLTLTNNIFYLQA